MSVPSSSYVFESGLQASMSASTTPRYLEGLIRQHLDMAAHDIPKSADTLSNPAERQSALCNMLLNDMGEYLTRTASIWAHLTQNLVTGPHIEQAATDAHTFAQRSTGLSDLSAITQLDMDLGKLCKIRDLTAQYARQVQQIWGPEAGVHELSPRTSSGVFSPYCTYRPYPVARALGKPEDSFEGMRKMLPRSHMEHASPPDDGSASDGSDDSDDEEFSQLDMDALRTRGKGNHICPKGRLCTKGGVDKDGNPVVFDRNSSFVQHCNKHRKPYRCNLEGCPNPAKKRKFARRDGLERHQRSVNHVAAPAVA